MDSLVFEGFDWDDGNWPKCGKHGMTQAEIEQVFANEPAVHDNPVHSDTEQRFKAIGQTNAKQGLRFIHVQRRAYPSCKRTFHAPKGRR